MFKSFSVIGKDNVLSVVQLPSNERRGECQMVFFNSTGQSRVYAGIEGDMNRVHNQIARFISSGVAKSGNWELGFAYDQGGLTFVFEEGVLVIKDIDCDHAICTLENPRMTDISRMQNYIN